MAGIGALRAAPWLTWPRMRAWAILLVAAYALAIAVLLVTASGGVDLGGRPIGTDFSDVWSAGRLALSGHAASAYDPATQYAVQQGAFHRPDIPFYAWLYPPWFLLVAAALALLPYVAAVILWQALGLGLYLRTISAILPRRETALLALAFTAVFVNLIHGQNGLLSAALLGGALLILDRRPLLAGVLFGLLAYKPQLGLFIPLALVASGRWRTIGAAAAVCAALALAATTLLGFDVWRAFASGMSYTRHQVLEDGGTGFFKMQSAFAAVRLWGGPVLLAYGAQALVAIAAGVGIVLLWRGAADARLKASGLIAASLLAPPYCLDYDLVLLAPAGAFYLSWALERAPRPFEKSCMALMFVAPILTRGVERATGFPLGLTAVALMFCLAVRAAAQPAASAPQGEGGEELAAAPPDWSSQRGAQA